MIEIIPNLWITSLKLYNPKIIISPLNKVKIDTTNKLTFIGKNRSFSGDLKTKILKNEIIQLYKYIENILSTINENILDNIIIIVCKNGQQISPLIATCYLIKYGNMSYSHALKSVKSKVSKVMHEPIFFDNIAKKIYSNYNDKGKK